MNEKFIQWLNSIFGKETMKQFRIEHRSDYMSLIANFEEKKRLLDSKGDKPICVQIPQFLKSSAEKGWGCSLEESFAKLVYLMCGLKNVENFFYLHHFC